MGVTGDGKWAAKRRCIPGFVYIRVTGWLLSRVFGDNACERGRGFGNSPQVCGKGELPPRGGEIPCTEESQKRRNKITRERLKSMKASKSLPRVGMASCLSLMAAALGYRHT